MHDSGGHMSGGDASSFSHTSHTSHSSPEASYHPTQNPNDVFYYANGGTNYASGGANYWPERTVRRGGSSGRGVVVLLAILLAAVLPIVIMLIALSVL
jgi:hypothetical protein